MPGYVQTSLLLAILRIDVVRRLGTSASRHSGLILTIILVLIELTEFVLVILVLPFQCLPSEIIYSARDNLDCISAKANGWVGLESTDAILEVLTQLIIHLETFLKILELLLVHLVCRLL